MLQFLDEAARIRANDLCACYTPSVRRASGRRAEKYEHQLDA